MMRRWAMVLCMSVLSACGSGGPPAPDWQSDSADLIERYKKYALEGENTLAERYFRQAINTTGGAGRVSETARLWLVRCATRRASLVDDDCHEYAELAKVQTTAEDRAYYQFVMRNWDEIDTARLAPHYAALVKTEPARRAAYLASIEDPLSRLLAAALLILRKQSDGATLSLAAETASAQGWRHPLLVYLKLLQKRAIERGGVDAAQAYAVRIRLIEDALASPIAK